MRPRISCAWPLAVIQSDGAALGGEFVRTDAQFRNWITPDGAPGPSGEGGFPARAGRYHLYVSLACPWAHRTLIVRRLKGLDALIGVSVVNPLMASEGWTFEPGPGVVGDPVAGATRLHAVYTRARPDYSGRVTVPVLWDKRTKRIVNNSEDDLCRMFNDEFAPAEPGGEELFSAALAAEQATLDRLIYETVNNGVYRAGFATKQTAYERAVRRLFATLDELERRLARARFLLGAAPVETDWRLFCTLVRFDAVYHGHFKCNLRRIVDYPNLQGYLQDLYQRPGIAETVNLAHIKAHYYVTHTEINPTGIVPLGPVLDLAGPHGRG